MRRRTSHPAPARVTVPGNLLLLGEYAVLEEGGLGFALAVERRLVVTAEPAPILEVQGSWGRDTVRWSDRDPESSPLFAEVVRACRRHLAGSPLRGPAPGLPAGRFAIDSSAFFHSPERKGGFGSSAAVAVGLASAILLLAGMDPELVRAVVPGLALEAHRAAQGGGSGYDVLTSAHGGTGLFTGGAAPGWQPRNLPWLPELFLIRGPRSVSSAGAVGRYRRWKENHLAQAERFLRDSNEAVRSFLAAGSWPEAEEAFSRSRRLGLWLGEQIGVDARIELPPGLPGGLGEASCKALGAGNELGVVALPSGQAPAREPAAGLEALVPAWEGVLWEA